MKKYLIFFTCLFIQCFCFDNNAEEVDTFLEKNSSKNHRLEDASRLKSYTGENSNSLESSPNFLEENSIAYDSPSKSKYCSPEKTSRKRSFSNKNFYIEALPGYYYPMEKRFREVYGEGGFNGQADLGYFFYERMAVFLRGGAFYGTGRSTALDNKTSIILANVTLGLKYVVPLFKHFNYYLGAGARMFFLRIHNDSNFVQGKVFKNKVGGAVVTGFLIYPSNKIPIFLDIFLDYSFYKFKFSSSPSIERNNLDVNGPTVGIGLGYQF